jgi:hypothetical protein
MKTKSGKKRKVWRGYVASWEAMLAAKTDLFVYIVARTQKADYAEKKVKITVEELS